MSRLGVTSGNQALDALSGSLPGSPINTLAYMALFVSDPGTTGASGENASTGGYARQSMTWNNAASNSKTNSNTAAYATAGTVPVPYAAALSAVTGGTYGIGIVLTSSVTSASIVFAPGSVTLTDS